MILVRYDVTPSGAIDGDLALSSLFASQDESPSARCERIERRLEAGGLL